MTTLVIVESPAKCKKIEGYLGPGYKCAASFGHIRGLADGLQCIDVDNDFRPTFKMLPGKGKYIKALRDKIRGARDVILATDDDREGEAIAWHLCKVFNLSVSDTKRIVFHEITERAIKRAVENPTHLNMDKVRAQQARQILDRLVGFRVSPVLWQHISRTTKSGLSAGRCQTPALRLIYDNQKDIDESPGRVVYETVGTFAHNGGDLVAFKLDHFHNTEAAVEDFLEESVNFEHIYGGATVKEKKRAPPKPFSTSSMQQKASNVLHISPKRTMRLAQTLYEKGFITYMRTDSKTYSADFLKSAQRFIKSKWGNQYVGERTASLTARGKSKGAQEAHEAIRPTKIDRVSLPDSVGAAEKRLYQLIWRNTTESCMSDAQYKLASARLTAPQSLQYKCSAESITFPGWLIVGGYERESKLFDSLLALRKGAVMDYHTITSRFTLKDLKTHYTEARLVQQLERRGIGRPSTFSSLVAKVQERGYVQVEDVVGLELGGTNFKLSGDEIEMTTAKQVFGAEKKKLVIQPLGTLVIEFLLAHFSDIFVYDYTQKMEGALDSISKGETVWHTLCRACHGELERLVGKVAPQGRQVIRIDANHVYTIAKYGPVIKCTEGKKVTFKPVRKDIDLAKLRAGGYALADLVDETRQTSGRVLGSYKNKDVILRKGKYGLYLNWDGKNISGRFLKKRQGDVRLEDVLDVLSGRRSTNPNVLLRLDGDAFSVRKGKYGPYIFRKTDSMAKPQFMNIPGAGREARDEWWRGRTREGIIAFVRSEYGL